MDEFKLLLIASDRLYYNGPCVSVTIPALDGDWGIMAHHAEMVTSVRAGELRFTTPDGTTEAVAVGPGFAQVNKRDVLVLAETIERPDEIDVNRARREYQEAQEALRQVKSHKEYRITLAAMFKAMGELKVKNHKK